MQLLKTNEPGALTAALQLLASACDAETTLEQLSEQVLGATLELISSSQQPVAQAAVELAYVASTSSAVRSRLCVQLLKPVQQRELAGGQQRLPSLWGICCRSCTDGALEATSTQVRSCYYMAVFSPS